MTDFIKNELTSILYPKEFIIFISTLLSQFENPFILKTKFLPNY